MSNKILAIAAIVFSFGSMGAKAIPIELVTNGGFETGDLTGWSCTGGDSCNASSGSPHTGLWNMQGYDNSGFATLSQTIDTILGESYDFSFFSHTNTDVTANVLRYQIGSGAIAGVLRTSSYAQTATSFVASSASTAISLFFETDGGTGTWRIDDVSVTGAGPGPEPVPVPATLALFGLGLAGLGWSRRKKT